MANNSLDPMEEVIIQSVGFADDYKIEITYHEQRDQVFERDKLIIGRQIHEMLDLAALDLQDEYDSVIDTLNHIIEEAYIRRRNPPTSYSRDPRSRRLRTQEEDDE